jgi:hypothetical protein
MVIKKSSESEQEDFSTSETLTHTNTLSTGKIKLSSRKKKSIIAILVIIVLILGGLYYQTHYSKKAVEKRAQAETIRLVKEVKKIIVLPESDVPAVFDIQDPVLLINQQAFFAGSEKGDKLLVYPQLGKAIIYSPKRKMIINVGPVTFDQAKSIQSGTGVSTPTVPSAQ